MVVLKEGDKRDAVRFLQRDLNTRARARNLPTVKQDGELGPATMTSVIRIGRELGALESTLAEATKKREVPIGLQRMIRWPENRNASQLQRAADRDKQTAPSGNGPEAALKEARRLIGVSERTHQSLVMGWIKQYYGVTYRVPWCGIFCRMLLIRAGVTGTSSRMAGVVLILEDAINGRNGLQSVIYRRRTGHGSVSNGKPGDLVGLYGESTHVGMIERRVPGGFQTIEGNTSSASQANGGSVQRKVRPDASIVYIVRPRWPR